MKNFHIPRTMEGGSRTESALGVILATVIGIVLAAALVHFWSMP